MCFRNAVFMLSVLLLFSVNSNAQNRFYHVYVDNDANPVTGCVVNLPDFSTTIDGVQTRLTVTTDNALPPNIVSTRIHQCDGLNFDAGTASSAAALGLNTGVSGSDVIEAAIDIDDLGINTSGNVFFYYSTDSDTAADIVLTNSSGGPIFLGFLFPVPALGLLALSALLILLVFTARKSISRNITISIVLLSFSSLVWAMNIIIDGQTTDWNGISPANTDPSGDTSAPGSYADLTAVFITRSSDDIFIRMDLVDVENQAPIANPTSDTTLEDNAVTITVTGSDAEGSAITFSADTPPNNGTLSAFTVVNNTTSTVQYTPNADFNGVDSFDIVANDGQINSAPAQVDVTVDPVNDAPLFTSSGDVSQLKTSGPYSELWATGIAPGPADESAQNVTFNITNNDNMALFDVQPSINSTGLLSFTGVADTSGVANITVNLSDDGGTANGGIDTSADVTFSITIVGVNDEPSFTVGADQTALEDAGPVTVAAWATNILAGPPDEAGQALTFNITANDNPTLFSAGPAVAADGTLTYTTALNANGSANITLELMDDGGTANGGDDTSPPASFTIDVTAVNDPPTFVNGADETVLEEAGAQTVNGWATSITPGPTDESAQSVTFNVTNNNNGLFSAQPAIDASGNLTYTPAADTSGTAVVSITASDDGGTANGGIDTSATQTFNISVTQVNDEPSFTVGADENILEDAGAQTVNAWATNVLAGPVDENGQNLTFNITANDNAALFSSGPTVAANGTLTYTTAADAVGTANISLELMDDGGTANGGDDTSPTQNFSITVSAVNDAPSFTAGADESVLEEAGSQTVNSWATNISPGPTDESGQTVSFGVTNNNNALFSVQPDVDASGNLTYTPAANTSGSATVSVSAVDDGGTANGGVDTSAIQNFTITVVGVNDAPSFTAASNPAASNEDGGAESLAWASAISAGPADESTQVLTFNLTQTSIDASLSFSTPPSVNSTTGNVEYTAAANTFGSASYNVVLMDDGGTANGGIDTSNPVVTLTVTVNPVNDPPSVTAPGPFTVTTNIRIAVPDGASDLLAGATDVEPGTTLSVQGTGTITTSQSGTITVNNANGTFTYDPPPGFTGADTFDYVVCDNGIPMPAACSTATTVTLNVSGNTVWFIDDTAAAGGDGTLQTPFNSLAAFNGSANPGDGDFVYLDTGSGTYTGAGITLANNQTLFGQGTTGAFDTITGITAAPLSIARPTLGGTRPVITSTANGINLATNNTIRGLDVGNTTSYGLRATAMGNFIANQISVTGNGGAIQVVSSGSFIAVNFDFLSSGSSSVHGIDINNVAGTLNVAGAGAGITNNSALSAVRINGGSFNMTYPGSIINTSGRSVEVTNKNIGTLSFTGLINDDGSGISLTNNSGSTINFSSLDLDTTINNAFIATGGGTVNVTGANNTIDTTTGIAVNIQNTNIGASGITLRSVNKNGTTPGIEINGAGTTGFFNVTGSGTTNGSGGTIQNNITNGILIQNTNNITLSNMNLSNAADEAAGCTASTFNTCTASVEFNAVNNITINNMFMDGSDEHGLFAQNISNIDINNSTFSNLGNVTSPEHAIFIRELSGTTATTNDSVFNGLTISGTGDSGVLIENATATGQISIQGNTSFTNMGEQGFIAETIGVGANLTVNLGNASAAGVGDTLTFSGLGAAAVALNANDGNLTAVVRNSEFNAGLTDLPNAIEGSSQGLSGNSSLSVMASGNNITIPDGIGTGRGGISFRADGMGSATGVIENNFIVSDEETVFGIRVNNTGSTNESQNNWTITNNTTVLTAIGATATTDGITVEADNPTGSAGVSAIISNNTVSATGGSGFTGGLELLVGVFGTPATNTSVVCTNISNNDINAPNATLDGFTTPGEADVVTASFGAGTRLNIAGLTVGPLTEAQVDTGITTANTAGDTTVFPAVAGAYAGIVTCP